MFEVDVKKHNGMEKDKDKKKEHSLGLGFWYSGKTLNVLVKKMVIFVCSD